MRLADQEDNEGKAATLRGLRSNTSLIIPRPWYICCVAVAVEGRTVPSPRSHQNYVFQRCHLLIPTQKAVLTTNFMRKKWLAQLYILN